MRIPTFILLALVAPAFAFAQQPGVQLFPLPPATAVGLNAAVLLADGSVIVAPMDPDVLYRVTSGGTATVLHTFPAGESAVSLAVSTDGTVWYASTQSVGRINLTGGIAPVAALTNISTLRAAPAGAMWVLRDAPPVTAVHIAPDGTLIHAPVPVSVSAHSITTSDGTFWLANFAGMAAVRVSPTGAVTSTPLPWNPAFLELSNRNTVVAWSSSATLPQARMELSLTGEVLGPLDEATYRAIVPAAEWQRGIPDFLERHADGNTTAYTFPRPAQCADWYYFQYFPLGVTADGHLWVLRRIVSSYQGIGPAPTCTASPSEYAVLMKIDLAMFLPSHGAADAPLSPAALAALIAVLGIAAFLRLRT